MASLVFGLVLACLLGTLAEGVRPPTLGAGIPVKRLDGEVGNLTAVIDGPGPTADAGVPFTLSASLGDAIGPFVYIWDCAAVGTTHSATWTVRLYSIGPERFSLEVGDAAGDVGWANLTVNVTAGPLLAAESVNRSADTGVPVGVAFAVSQGVAPYRVQWAVNGGATTGSVNLSAAGTVEEPLWTNATGPVWVTANVSDAVGGSDAASTWVSQAAVAPSLALTVPGAAGEVGVAFYLTAAVLGGTPPISWTAGALGPVVNTTPPHGTLDGAGTVSWNATPTSAGPLIVWMTTVDALGVARAANVSVRVVSPVNASLVVLNRSLIAGTSINVSALVQGGVAPYTVDWVASNGVRAVGTVVVPGPLNWTVPAIAAGFLTIDLTVRDAAGGTASTAATLFIAPAPTPSAAPAGGGADDATSWLAGLAIAAGAGVVGVWWWRGRQRAQAHAALAGRARADRFVAEAIRARNGIDADDLQGLGDAQSLFPEEIAGAVDRLLASGAVRAEYETGDPVYFWGTTTGDGTAAPSEGSRPEDGQ